MAKIRVRARAVDMLGRQQIAGIPTAIHELFKNAHDAYAHNVEVDYLRADDLLILRDDGLGMTREDFEGKWLTLGTESKVGMNLPNTLVWTGPGGEKPRPIMGEKGIGRLAIAAIGPVVLVASRALRPGGLHNCVAGLIHWGLFEIPGLDLDQIDIPVVELPSGQAVSASDLRNLVTRMSNHFLSLPITAETINSLLEDLKLFDFSPEDLIRQLEGPSILNEGYGTQFFVRPVNPILADDIDTASDDIASPLEKMLLGFSNTMMPDRPLPVIKAEFRDHRQDSTIEELIGGNSFFTPDEFLNADHHIEGTFDRFGQFSGSVQVYGKEPVEHAVRWQGAGGRETQCGEFKIKFAYVQGRANESRLPPSDWAQISSKLNRIGGLYVYRDGIRVLPYGNSDFDFLNIERRRTKSAQDWFFSYRRIFGAVEISHAENSNLVEKAGREGFRANRAYREFVDILERFFERLALDFFRPTSLYGNTFNSAKDQLIKDAALLARREQSTRERRRRFSANLDRFFSDVETDAFTISSRQIIDELSSSVEAALRIQSPDLRSSALLKAESDARDAADKLRSTAVIQRPRGVGLSKVQQRDWAAYGANFDKIQDSVIAPLYRAIDEKITEGSGQTDGLLTRRRRVTTSLERKRSESVLVTNRLKRDVETQVGKLTAEVSSVLETSVRSLASDIEQTLVELERTDTQELDDVALEELQLRWEGRVDETTERAKDLLESLRDQLQNVVTAVREQDMLDATTAALESESESLRDQLNNYIELAQTGMALGVVQHEFSNTVRGIRTAIRKLKPWAEGTPALRSLEKELRVGFDHLDAYLALFTPMSRRLNRVEIELSGEEVRKYLDEVFGDRIRRHNIEIRVSSSFDQKTIHAFAATFFPAFVNLVDNAIYWCQVPGIDRGARWISLDSDDRGFLISNSGPPIDARVASRIFEFGQSMKPGGRGMGLFLSQQALRKEGYDLSLESAGSNGAPVFRISTDKTSTLVED